MSKELLLAQPPSSGKWDYEISIATAPVIEHTHWTSKGTGDGKTEYIEFTNQRQYWGYMNDYYIYYVTGLSSKQKYTIYTMGSLTKLNPDARDLRYVCSIYNYNYSNGTGASYDADILVEGLYDNVADNVDIYWTMVFENGEEVPVTQSVYKGTLKTVVTANEDFFRRHAGETLKFSIVYT